MNEKPKRHSSPTPTWLCLVGLTALATVVSRIPDHLGHALQLAMILGFSSAKFTLVGLVFLELGGAARAWRYALMAFVGLFFGSAFLLSR